jgi:hypothetical protein
MWRPNEPSEEAAVALRIDTGAPGWSHSASRLPEPAGDLDRIDTGGVTMASERQIAANRRNARRSTGPRSGAGKKRASRNAYCHGLSLSITSSAASAKQLEKLVRKIAGNSQDPILLERARALAQAELDLARVRRAKVALIERASALGELDPPRLFGTATQLMRAIRALERGRMSSLSEPIDASATMPSQEPDRSAEAVRRVLPELRKLDRYERRAAARRDRTASEIAGRTKT